jgi:predicted short-subunit dehydrogenase-like oxidoreductase (DUF2520 family)
MLPDMKGRPSIAIVGAGNLGSALAVSLKRAGYVIEAVISRPQTASLTGAKKLAEEVGADAQDYRKVSKARIIWFAVPDGNIARVSDLLAKSLGNRRGFIAFHSSGVLTSDAMAALGTKGMSLASVHPLMTFVRGSRPSLVGVPFAIEGDRLAVRAARQVVRDLGGLSYPIRKQDKTAYHAWATFTSPLLTALLVTAQRVARTAGIPETEARRRMAPIVLQTVANYASFGADEAFSGPIIRGDVATVKKHLQVLRRVPIARSVYLSLASAALEFLPNKKPSNLRRVLQA